MVKNGIVSDYSLSSLEANEENEMGLVGEKRKRRRGLDGTHTEPVIGSIMRNMGSEKDAMVVKSANISFLTAGSGSQTCREL